MSFATRKMTDTDVDAPNEIAMPYKTATPQILPPMLRLHTSANASASRVIQSSTLSPAAVEITISRSNVMNNPLAAINSNQCLFQNNFQNRPVSAPLEQTLDYQHDAFSTVPDLKQRLSNLDKEIRVGEEAPSDSIKSVVQMHNSVLQKNDASIQKLRSKHRETKGMFEELAQSHFTTNAKTKEYLEMAQTMMESHSSELQQHQKQINAIVNTKSNKTNDSTHEYLHLSQNVFESHNEAIRALQEQTASQMEQIDELHEMLDSNAGRKVDSTNGNTQEYLKMSQSMLEGHNVAIADLQNKMKQTLNLSQQVSEHKRHIAELRDTHDELRETIQLHEDEFDALHEQRA